MNPNINLSTFNYTCNFLMFCIYQLILYFLVEYLDIFISLLFLVSG